MIAGLVQLLFFQGAGELLSKFLLPTLPGPVVGLVLLLIFLIWKGRVNASLALVGDAFLRYLGLLFVPAAVGIALFLPLLKANALTLTVALIGSVILTIASSAWVLRLTHRSDAP